MRSPRKPTWSPDTAEITDTADVTKTTEVTRTTTSKPTGGNSGGASSTAPTTAGSTANSCPDPATLGAVTPNFDPQYPIIVLNCGGEWAVGTYDADGKNQTTGIWRNTGAEWDYQDRDAICATADSLPAQL